MPNSEEKAKVSKPIIDEKAYYSERPPSGFAIVAFVLGLIGLLIPVFAYIQIFTIFFAIAAIIDCQTHNKKGMGFAITSIVLAVMSIAVWFALYSFIKSVVGPKIAELQELMGMIK
ncbi:hypothetical protein KY339_04230 [Candidatus Woesearchaeota archaeon]|nr:hypothetical protein [Candidatus Woesearchaeota archaeon]